MRIRQVRPEFFSDPIVGRLTPDARLIYIGLWCVADDAGFLDWDLPHIAAMLSPYESVPVRERRMTRAADALVAAERIEVFPCGHALIPTLETHQKIGGNKSFLVRDRHLVHTRPNIPGLVRPVGRVGRVGSEVGNSRIRATEDDDLRASYRRQGLPVDVA